MAKNTDTGDETQENSIHINLENHSAEIIPSAEPDTIIRNQKNRKHGSTSPPECRKEKFERICPGRLNDIPGSNHGLYC